MSKNNSIDSLIKVIDSESVDPSPFRVESNKRSKLTSADINGYRARHWVSEERKIEYRTKGQPNEYCVEEITKTEAITYEHELGDVRIERSLGGTYRYFPSGSPSGSASAEHKIEPTDWRVVIAPEDPESTKKYLEAIGIESL